MKPVNKTVLRLLFLVAVGVVVILNSWIIFYSLITLWFAQSFNATPNPEAVQIEYAAKLPFHQPGKDVIFFTQGAWAGDYTPMIGICSSLKQCEFGEFNMNMFDKNQPIQVSHVDEHIVQLAQDERKQLMNLATLTTIPGNAILEEKLQRVGCLFRPKDALRWTFNQENCEK